MKRRSFLKAIGLMAAAPAAVMAKPERELRFGRVEGVGYYESDPSDLAGKALAEKIDEDVLNEASGNRSITIDEITKQALRIMHEQGTLIT